MQTGSQEEVAPVKCARLLSRNKVKAFRERLRNDPLKYAAQKEADKNRKQASRAKLKEELLKETPSATKLRAAIRAKETERKRKLRSSKNQQDASNDVVTPTKVYPTKQAAGKALQCLHVRLPFSLRKRKVLTLKLAIEAGNMTVKSLSSKVRETDDQKMVRVAVEEFYNRDDISK